METNLDRLHRDRLKAFFGKGEIPPDEIFLSEHVVQTLAKPKIFLGTFDQNKILGLLPFTPVIYVEICPECVTKENLSAFETLTRSGLIVPILTSPYSAYGDFVDVFAKCSHASIYEAGRFVWQTLMRFQYEHGGHAICPHCAEKRIKAMVRATKDDPEAQFYKSISHHIRWELDPYLSPDYELLDRAVKACKDRDGEALFQLSRLSGALHQFRRAQAFSAETIVDSAVGKLMPVADKFQGCGGAGYAELSAASLGLEIPKNVPLDAYIEIVKDYQPSISRAINELIKRSTESDGKVSFTKLAREIERINKEVARVRSLKRYRLLEVCVDFYKNNRGLISTALVASAFGLAGSIAGCGATLATGMAAGAARKFGLLKGSKSARRLGKELARDLRPQIDRVIASYVDTVPSAINVLSLQNKLKSA